MSPSRRGFLGFLGSGAAAVLAAPAIVRVTSLMPVKALGDWRRLGFPYEDGFTHYRGYDCFTEMVTDTLRRYRGELAHNIIRNNPLLERLRRTA